jgi:hypothetical protein
MRRTAPPSRPYGRYAVGLRPSLDPDAYLDAPSQDQEARKTNKQHRDWVLTGPAPSGMTSVIPSGRSVATPSPRGFALALGTVAAAAIAAGSW